MLLCFPLRFVRIFDSKLLTHLRQTVNQGICLFLIFECFSPRLRFIIFFSSFSPCQFSLFSLSSRQFSLSLPPYLLFKSQRPIREVTKRHRKQINAAQQNEAKSIKIAKLRKKPKKIWKKRERIVTSSKNVHPAKFKSGIVSDFRKTLKKVKSNCLCISSLVNLIFEWKNNLYKAYEQDQKFMIESFFATLMYIWWYEIICAIHIQIIEKLLEMYSSNLIITAQMRLKNYWKHRNQIIKYIENHSKVFYS